MLAYGRHIPWIDCTPSRTYDIHSVQNAPYEHKAPTEPPSSNFRRHSKHLPTESMTSWKPGAPPDMARARGPTIRIPTGPAPRGRCHPCNDSPAVCPSYGRRHPRDDRPAVASIHGAPAGRPGFASNGDLRDPAAKLKACEGRRHEPKMTSANGVASVAEALWGRPVRPARIPARVGYMAGWPTQAPLITPRVLITQGGGSLRRRYIRSRREKEEAREVMSLKHNCMRRLRPPASAARGGARPAAPGGLVVHRRGGKVGATTTQRRPRFSRALGKVRHTGAMVRHPRRVRGRRGAGHGGGRTRLSLRQGLRTTTRAASGNGPWCDAGMTGADGGGGSGRQRRRS